MDKSELKQLAIKRPKADDDLSIFEVKVAFMAPSSWTPDDAWTFSALAIAKTGSDVIAGYNAEAKNLTSFGPPSHRVGLIAFKNKSIPKAMEDIPIFRITTKKGKRVAKSKEKLRIEQLEEALRYCRAEAEANPKKVSAWAPAVVDRVNAALKEGAYKPRNPAAISTMISVQQEQIASNKKPRTRG